MFDIIIELLSQGGGQFSLGTITLAFIIHTNRRLKKHIEQSTIHHSNINLLKDANRMQMRQILKEIHDRSESTRKVSDQDWKIWNETFGVYQKLGGNGVASGWDKDIQKWRS